MNALLLISIILGVSFQNVARKPFSQRASGKGVYFFCLMTSLAAMIFFVVTSGGFEWNTGLIFYAALFALAYTVANIFGLEAVACGPLSITSLITSYSLMIPTVYGLVFLKDHVGVGLFPGLALLAISLFLLNQKNVNMPVTVKWIVFVFLAFIGNGMCTVVQKMQQIKFNGAFKNEFMILSLAISSVALCFFVFIKERNDLRAVAKIGWFPALACGLANGMVNLFVMILSNRMPVSLMFPMISAGGIIITYLVSRFFYKEKLTKTQFAGFIIGIVSAVLLNI